MKIEWEEIPYLNAISFIDQARLKLAQTESWVHRMGAFARALPDEHKSLMMTAIWDTIRQEQDHG